MRHPVLLALTLSACFTPTTPEHDVTEAPAAFDARPDVQTRPDAWTPEAIAPVDAAEPEAAIAIDAPEAASEPDAAGVEAIVDAAPHCPSTCATYCIDSTCAGLVEGGPCYPAPSKGACPAGMTCTAFVIDDAGKPVDGYICADSTKIGCGGPHAKCCHYSLIPYECVSGLHCQEGPVLWADTCVP